jgi:starch synthase
MATRRRQPRNQPPSKKISRVAHVTREYGRIAGVGGIKDVVEGLCGASADSGIDTHVFLPYYRLIDRRQGLQATPRCVFDVTMNYPGTPRAERVAIHSVQLRDKLTLHLIDSHRYRFLAEGDHIPRYGIYQYTKEEAQALGDRDRENQGYVDFFAMNVLLVKSTLRALELLRITPDIIHCHDGHAALLPVIAQTSNEGYAPILRYVPEIVTIHNAGRGYHQEIADLDFAAAICSVSHAVIDGCLLKGSFDPLIAGPCLARRLIQ